ncbi:MAG: YbaB/EbfC family nucleoid-associated protein [Proteobacteria bacterium]|nr:YbaB/EbfC family nucleoid-associated protein [Pseudomonadota bacterium]
MQNFSKMMKQAQKLQSDMASVQEKVAQQHVEGTSGAGLVKVVLNGKGDVISVSLDPSLLNPEEADVLEDLIVAAFSDGKRKSEAMMATEMEKIMGGMKGLGGLSLPF